QLTSMRLAGGYNGTPASRCALPIASQGAQAARSDIAGVFIHATAVRNLIERDAVSELGVPMRAILTIAFATLIAIAACLFVPTGVLFIHLGFMAIYTVCALSRFVHGLALPLTEPALAGLAAAAMMIGYRFVVADRDQRFLRKSFALYLAPEIIDTMVASG